MSVYCYYYFRISAINVYWRFQTGKNRTLKPSEEDDRSWERKRPENPGGKYWSQVSWKPSGSEYINMVRFMGLGFLILRNGIFSLSCSQGWRWLLWLKLLKFRRRSNITKWCFNMSSCRTRCRCGRIFFKWKGSEMFSQVQQGAEGVEEDCYWVLIQ